MKSAIDGRASERGAVKIQTILAFALIGIAAFVILKVAPIYIEQRSIQTQVDELARLSAVRSYKQDQVNKGIATIITEYSLPEGSVTIVALAENKVQLKLQYTRTIDFLVAQWDWAVSYTADGRAI
jgi:uncharacterized membrane protein